MFNFFLFNNYMSNFPLIFNPHIFVKNGNNPHIFVKNGNKTIIHTSPIKNFISPLGMAVHPDKIVLSDSYKMLNTPRIATFVPSTINYIDVNSDPALRKKMTQYFFDKTVKSWLYSDFDKLLKYLVIKGNSVKIVSNPKAQEKNKIGNAKDMEKKIHYLSRNVMTIYDMKQTLKQLVRNEDVNWYDLKDNKGFVKRKIYKKMKSMLKKLIGN